MHHATPTMLIGYVSDERYVALADVQVEISNEELNVEVRSRASGAVYADLPSGDYDVVLAKPGYGPKRVSITHDSTPHHFRLLKDELLGYAWPKCVKAGERSEFRVHSPVAYKLSLWRYGWEKNLVRKIGWFDEHGPRATVQITPDGDYTQAGVCWNRDGYSSPHHKQFITAPELSGLYYFHVESEAGDFFAFPWIVAPAQPSTSIAVLANDITWNAYNNFGGRSNYIHPVQLTSTPTVNARLELRRYTDPDHMIYDAVDYAPLSFDRPEPINHIPKHTQVTDPIEGRAACHVAPTEWRMLGWLEREGYPYDLYSETQLHHNQLPLSQYKILLIGTHPEYWSRTMYDRVKRWVFEEGGRLIYLGGNGLNCEVEFVNDTSCIYRNDDTRRMNDDNSTWESRLHLRHESEANLLGVVFDPRGIMTAAPYRVVDDQHWAFAKTGLKRDNIFGATSLHERVPGGASGHETDKMSTSSPANTHLLARGLNDDGGGAEIVIHEHSSGGTVFSVGSICWTTSLLVDEHVSQITANVIERFLNE